MILFSLSISVIIALTPKVSGSFVCCPEHATKVNAQMNIHNAIIIFFIISSSKFPVCCSILTFKLYHKTCEQFYRNLGTYEKSPNSFLPGLPRSIVNQFRFHNLLCLCLASVHLPYPFHLVFGFQLFGHAVLLCQRPHDQLHAVLYRFVNLGAILSFVHPAIRLSSFFTDQEIGGRGRTRSYA